MYRRAFASAARRITILLAALFILVQPFVGSSDLRAQPLTKQQVSSFLADPSSILNGSPNGGSKLVSTVRDLMLSDATTLRAIINVAKNLNSQLQTATDAEKKKQIQAQLSAIGSGLGQAALALVQSNPDLANQIQTALAATDLQLVIAAYSVTTGNVVTASGGNPGGGGGVGGPINPSIPGGGGSGGGAGAPGGSGGVGSSGGLTGIGGNVGGGTAPLSRRVSPS